MDSKTQKILAELTVIFFISGFSALIYQVSWQRLLFTNIGVDLSSITVIISVFMVGLGIGAYFGGRLADKFSQRVILLFCIAEAAIGLFGFASYHLILGIGNLLITANLWQVAFMNFLLLLLPTFMMGATLPLLTFYFNQRIQNIGESIGSLYFYNTLGAALGSLATGFVLYNYLTLSQTIYLAASLNTVIATLMWFRYHKKDEHKEENHAA